MPTANNSSAPKADKARIKCQESLLSLYLRLNGFFVTGFIVHSPIHGRNQTQLDALAVRFPHNAEHERQITPHELLELSDTHIDLLLCEVKSRGQKLHFNSALTSASGTIASVLRWAGLFLEDELPDLALQVQNVLRPGDPPRTSIPTVVGPRQTRIRGLICSPERTSRRPNQPWFLPGPALLDYTWRCLCPQNPRLSCATTYDFGLWGENYEYLIRYFKGRGRTGAGSISDLYAHLWPSN